MLSARPDVARWRVPAALVCAALGTGGCAPWLERPFAGLRDRPVLVGTPLERPAPCAGGPWPSRGWRGRGDVLAVGPLRFVGLAFPNGPQRFAPGSPPLTVEVVVPPDTRAVIAVPRGRRGVVGLDSGPVPASDPARAHRTLACTAGESERIYTIAFAVAGARCVPVSVETPGGRWVRDVPFGRRCPSRP